MRDFENKSYSLLDRELTVLTSKGELKYTLRKVQIAYSIYSKCIEMDNSHIVKAIKLALNIKSDIEAEKYLEFVSRTRNIPAHKNTLTAVKPMKDLH